MYVHCYLQLIVQNLPEQPTCGPGRGAIASPPKSKPARLISIVSGCTDVVEAHCYVSNIGQIHLEHICTYVPESILFAGGFNPVGLCQLRTKLFCMQLAKAYRVEASFNQ